MNDTAVLSRRGFLKFAAGAAAGVAAVSILPQVATAAPLRYVASNFSATQTTIVRQALNIVANRFLDGRMFQWTRTRYRQSYASIPGRTFRTAADFQAWFVRIQLAALTAVGFPLMNIRGQSDPRGNWTGRAPEGRVRTEYYVINGRNQPRVTGQFDVTLNTGLLGTRAYQGTNANYWAGVIAHEMLHNLGHQHPVNVYDGLFIRVYQNAVACNANPNVRG